MNCDDPDTNTAVASSLAVWYWKSFCLLQDLLHPCTRLSVVSDALSVIVSIVQMCTLTWLAPACAGTRLLLIVMSSSPLFGAELRGLTRTSLQSAVFQEGIIINTHSNLH